LAAELAHHLGAELGRLDACQFPDGETYLRFASSSASRSYARLRIPMKRFCRWYFLAQPRANSAPPASA
jgi:hypothetical protein